MSTEVLQGISIWSGKKEEARGRVSIRRITVSLLRDGSFTKSTIECGSISPAPKSKSFYAPRLKVL